MNYCKQQSSESLEITGEAIFSLMENLRTYKFDDDTDIKIDIHDLLGTTMQQRMLNMSVLICRNYESLIGFQCKQTISSCLNFQAMVL